MAVSVNNRRAGYTAREPVNTKPFGARAARVDRPPLAPCLLALFIHQGDNHEIHSQKINPPSPCNIPQDEDDPKAAPKALLEP